MGLSPQPRPVISFHDFELDLATGELRRQGNSVGLPYQPARVLALLASRPGELVSRDEIVRQIWGSETFVDSVHGLNAAIRQIRMVLGDSADNPRFIQTLPKRGYRFVADLNPPVVPNVSPRETKVIPFSPRRRSKRRLVLRGLEVILVLTAAIIIVLNVRATIASHAKPRPIRSLAILPLSDLSGDPSQQYFADGMADELITDLAQLTNVRVISRTSTAQYRNTHKTARQIGRELGVDALIEGSIERQGNRVRFRVQLIDAATDEHLWARSYERQLTDALRLQNDAARDIAEQIQVQLSSQETTRLAESAHVKPGALEAYLRGRYYFNQSSQESVEQALAFFRRATEIDPGYAPAHAAEAQAYELLAGLGFVTPKIVLPAAEAAATKALKLDSNLADAHAALAAVYRDYDWNWSASDREIQRALQLRPNDSWIRLESALNLAVEGKFDAMKSELQLAQSLDPLSVHVAAAEAFLLFAAGDTNGAIAQCRRLLQVDRNSPNGHLMLHTILMETGAYRDAQNEWIDYLNLIRRQKEAQQFAQSVPADPEKTKSAIHKDELRLFLDLAKNAYVPADYIAGAYLANGDTSNALTSLERALDEHSASIVFLRRDPTFAVLRSDPRFKRIVERVGLPE